MKFLNIQFFSSKIKIEKKNTTLFKLKNTIKY